MPSPRQDAAAERSLLRLTGLPTATGHEDRVVAWVHQWAKRRPAVEVKTDKYGNLMVQRRDANGRSPIVFTAHLDHPAFVVTQADGQTITAEFRGGVRDEFFPGAPVQLFRGASSRVPAGRGVVASLTPAQPGGFKTATIRLAKQAKAQPGDILTWDLPAAEVIDGQLHAPACDDLAGAAAMFEAYGRLLKAGGDADVRLLCTRAEEIGFIGAIGACKSGIIPKRARLIALETSKSFADSPIGGGPIVRIGDRTSTFDPGLTYAVGQIAQRIAGEDPSFTWQRKLMPGGTCEASAYQALGYTATCVCLALGNYHNMDEDAGRIDREFISLADYHGLVRLLQAVAESLDKPDQAPGLASRLDQLFADYRHVLPPRKA